MLTTLDQNSWGEKASQSLQRTNVVREASSRGFAINATATFHEATLLLKTRFSFCSNNLSAGLIYVTRGQK